MNLKNSWYEDLYRGMHHFLLMQGSSGKTKREKHV